jgi:deoxyribodipyrimidine photo-lyase
VGPTVALLTRDLRVRDNPALAPDGLVVPLFVLDPSLLAISPNRHRFLLECLTDLRRQLRSRGSDLVVRRGDPVVQAMRVARRIGAQRLTVAADVSPYARRRERRLNIACARVGIGFELVPGSTVVAPGALRPAGGGPAYRMFTPFYRAWRAAAWRPPEPTHRPAALPGDLDPGRLPAGPRAGLSPDVAIGGETAARRQLRRWLSIVDSYDENLAADRTSRLSPYLRFGCVSAVEVVTRTLRTHSPAAEAFARQLCWRDFFYQVAAGRPDLAGVPLRANVADQWRDDPEALAAWQQGRTGVPIVDAGMRQLRAEGWMHNRARLVVGDYLTKHLGLDWRAGAAWFERWLLDGDLPNNYGNWQWVSGVGNDSRPSRRFNPERQAARFDPDGTYIGRYAHAADYE